MVVSHIDVQMAVLALIVLFGVMEVDVVAFLIAPPPIQGFALDFVGEDF